MDFMRKLVRGNSLASPSPSGSDDHTFSLLTLRRLFMEYRSSTAQSSNPEQEKKLYEMLPLFYEVFNDSPHSMNVKFADVLQFATQLAQLMVSEIKRRASNKSTEEASAEITNFLLVQETSEKSRGWLLINVLNILVLGGQQIVDCMTTMHLPSTLIKCLYLFFDLPNIPPSSNTTQSATATAPVAPSPKYKLYQPGSRKQAPVVESPMKRGPNLPSSILVLGTASILQKREALQKLFIQVLNRLCRHISPAEELSHRDDLSLLFSAVTSWCPPHNTCWRKAAGEILSTISRHGLSHNVVQYIRRKKCIGTCIENMHRSLHSKGCADVSEISELDLAFALVTVISFLNDTAEVTQLLLDDFKQYNGYEFIRDYILRLEELCVDSPAHVDAMLCVLNAVENLALCGFMEITPSTFVQSPFQSKYVIPNPIGKGSSIRNPVAFSLLEKLFMRGATSFLCCSILDAILNIYQRDPANYFMLVEHHTIPLFTEFLAQKDDGTIEKFFSLLEYIAITLGYVPCKELVSLTLLLKDESSPKCSIETIRSLQRIFQHDQVLYSEVFRDVGVLEVLVKCLSRYAHYLKRWSDKEEEWKEQYAEIGECTMDILAILIHSSSANAGVFRDTGGGQAAYTLVPFIHCRGKALFIVEQLILQKSGGDDMGILLGILSTVSVTDFQLKMDILNLLLKVMSKSREARIIFRKVGGFINVISVLVSIEGCLSSPPSDPWKEMPKSDILKLLKVTFHTLSFALRLPSNRRFFQSEVRFDSLRSAVQYLGCFANEQQSLFDPTLSPSDPPLVNVHLPDFNETHRFESLTSMATSEIVTSITSVFKFLFLLATDSFKDELEIQLQQLTSSSSITGSISSTHSMQSVVPSVLHPHVISVMTMLIPLIPSAPTKQIQLDLQYYLLNEIIWLLTLERNEQVLCRSDLVSVLLVSYSNILADDKHYLNTPLQRILERLITQASTPHQLREFLRIGRPLHCDDALVKKNSVSLSRVKNLVSMATPRNVSFQDDYGSKSLLPPSFIEFDMSLQGCGFIFIPSLFPQSVTGVQQTTGGSGHVSGVGSVERIFPPAGGISVSCWMLVEKFCNNSLHPIRILTIAREVLATKQLFACLSIHITAKNRRLLISTQEEDLNQMVPGDIEEVSQLISTSVSFDTQKFITESQWHHIVVTINKATVLKHSTAIAYIDGNPIGSAKVRYIHSNPVGLSLQNSPVLVHGFVGTPSHLSARSQLLWRLSSLHVMDESITANNIIPAITNLGPSYIGNLQSIELPDGSLGSVLPEDRICFSLLAPSWETWSMSRLQKHNHKFDGMALAKQLSMELTDGLTPVLRFQNCCLHCAGSARSFGAMSLQDLSASGVRCFNPAPVAKVLQSIGGVRIILSLVSMASDIESLYAAVKSLVCVIESNPSAADEMGRIQGYQALAMQMKRKKPLLNSHVLHLVYSLTGTVHAGRGSSFIPNISAFEDLLCDLEVWHNAPNELHKSLFEHLLRLMTESNDTNENIDIMRELGMTRRCLHFLVGDSTLSLETTKLVFEIISILIKNSVENNADLLRFGQFLVSTIPPTEFTEEHIKIINVEKCFAENIKKEKASSDGTPRHFQRTSSRDICLRNLGINMLRKCLKWSVEKTNSIFCETLQRTLGWDWILLFQLHHLHASTVEESLLLLVDMLWCSKYKISLSQSTSTSSLATGASGTTSGGHLPPSERFRMGESCGGWLSGTNAIIDENKAESLLGFNVSGGEEPEYQHEIYPPACNVEGFAVLASRLKHHAHIPQLYLVLLRFAVGHKPIAPPAIDKFDLDTTYHHILGIHDNRNALSHSPSTHMLQSVDVMTTLSLDMLQVVLEIVQSMLNQDSGHQLSSSWIIQYPKVILQTLIYIYQFNHANLSSLFATQPFLSNLIATVFPKPNDSVVDTSVHQFTNPPLLSNHPAKEKFVFDLLRMILFDSLSASPNDGNYQVANVILESSPPYCTLDQLKEFQTEIMSYIMSNLLAADPLSGETGALLQGGSGQVLKDGKSTSENAYFNIQTNVANLASKIVDRVWLDMFKNDVNEVFLFIRNLLTHAKNKRSNCSHVVLEHLHRSLYRVIFFQLCRRHHTVAEQMKMLDNLHQIITNKDLIFANDVSDQLLMPCLAHCLFTVSNSSYGYGFGFEEENRQTVWHVASPSVEFAVDALKEEAIHAETENSPGEAKTPAEKSKRHLMKTIARLWNEIPSEKKKLFEEQAKVQLVDLGGEQANLDSARNQLKDHASKAWTSYLSLEKRGNAALKMPQKFAKKVSSLGLAGLNKGRIKKENKTNKISIEDANLWSLKHVAVVQDLVNLQQKGYKQDLDHLVRYADEEWSLSEAELFRERGVWGPTHPCLLHKWMLDSTEGPSRMRKKLTRNDEFYQHYPHRSKQELLNFKTKHKKPVSHDSREYYRRVMGLSEDFDKEKVESDDDKLETKLFNDDVLDKTMTETTELHNLTITPGDMDILNTSKTKDSEDSALDNDDDKKSDLTVSESQSNLSEQDNKPDNQTVLRLLENGERIKHMFRCARVQGLDTYEGLLLFGRENFYIIDGFTMLKTKEIREISSLSPGYHEPIIPQSSRPTSHDTFIPPPTTTSKHVCSRFSYDDIREVHKRRYLLQNIALEIFSSDGRNYLLVFPQNTRNKVHNRFISVATTLTDDTKDLVAGQKNMINIEQQGSTLLSNIMGEKTVTQRWERNEISNFQYLMYLNTLAGRSYNDLMQYPVFPWVLADYTSKVLDLNDPATFRDFSKPMGAQTPSRLEDYKKRYKEWEDLGGDAQPCHYATHYSSAMIVASYLVRMEPFTQHFLRLQGGHFDLADRMFHSIADSWYSASKKNMADVKELIPEFFYLPDFLLNSNQFDLGQKQNGTKLHDVVLPPWAKGSAREFIRVHREALECDYVSAHLHEWIDLVFGYKQKGEAAYNAHNVFHHLFYEGEVDIYSITDPLKRNATIGFINNFGQIPKQLFKKAHVQKRVVWSNKSSDNNANNAIANSAVTLAPAMFGFSEFPPKPFYRNLNNLKISPSPVKVLKDGVGPMHMNDRVLLAVERNKVLIPPTFARYLSWGHSDNGIRIGYYESERAMQVFENLNCGDITCAVVPTDKLLITGGSNSVVNVWRIPTVKEKFKSLQLKQSLHAHSESITCLAACTAFGVLVSGSNDCTCVVWDLNKLMFVRQLRSHKQAVSNIVINNLTGDIYTTSGTYLHMWSINGDPIAKVNTLLINSRKQHITALAVSELNEWDKGSVVATGHFDGYIKFWRLDYVSHSGAPRDQGIDDDKISLKSDIVGFHRHYDDTDTPYTFDTNSLDSISITSMQVESSAIEASQSVDSISRINNKFATDAVSLVSVGEMAVLPWNDISQIEVPKTNNPDSTINKQENNEIKKLDAKEIQWSSQLLLEGKVQLIKEKNVRCEPTSIFISKDQTKLYAGNRKGEIFCWTVAD